MYKKLFVTYNSGSQFGQNTALRLQTISNLYGLSVMLPSRYLTPSVTLSTDTQERINESDIIVIFSLEVLSHAMKAEIELAMSLDKPIVILNDHKLESQFEVSDYANLKEVKVDFEEQEKAADDIARFLNTLPATTVDEKKSIELGSALLAIGVGLLALWALSRKRA